MEKSFYNEIFNITSVVLAFINSCPYVLLLYFLDPEPLARQSLRLRVGEAGASYQANLCQPSKNIETTRKLFFVFFGFLGIFRDPYHC